MRDAGGSRPSWVQGQPAGSATKVKNGGSKPQGFARRLSTSPRTGRERRHGKVALTSQVPLIVREGCGTRQVITVAPCPAVPGNRSRGARPRLAPSAGTCWDPGTRIGVP